MTKKQGTKSRPKKTSTPKKTEVRLAIQMLARRANVPLLKEAIICQVDEHQRWRKTGLAMSVMPEYAEMAAELCHGDKCFFCAAAQVPIAEEKMFHFQPEYPLCDCLTPLRKMAHDYIAAWNTPEGGKALLAQVTSGSLSLRAPVYQYNCTSCKKGPVIVDAKTVANSIELRGRHTRRKICQPCYVSIVSRRTIATSRNKLVAATPKQGPAAKLTHKIKHPEKGPLMIASPQPLTVSKETPGAPTT